MTTPPPSIPQELQDLERINAELSGRNLCLMQLDNLKFAFYRINRGAGYGGYDTYTRLRGGYDSVQSALEHAPRRRPTGEESVMTVIKGDVFATRGMARAIASLLRQRGFCANVEQSGPVGRREYRVVVAHPAHDGAVAYFHEGDRVDAFEPHWV
jgi:hypothetical protein